jgi:hypothetical protein
MIARTGTEKPANVGFKTALGMRRGPPGSAVVRAGLGATRLALSLGEVSGVGGGEIPVAGKHGQWPVWCWHVVSEMAAHRRRTLRQFLGSLPSIARTIRDRPIQREL